MIVCMMLYSRFVCIGASPSRPTLQSPLSRGVHPSRPMMHIAYVSHILAKYEAKLRAVVPNERHVLRYLFPSEKPRIYDLHPRAHNSILPGKDDSIFIPRVLFRF